MAAKKQQKTSPTVASPDAFVKAIPDPARREDCLELLGIMRKATKLEPRMWGPAMVGFGEFHYRYPSGHEGDTFVVGFASRKDAITLYFMTGLERHRDALLRLGKHKAGKGCLYVRSLRDVDASVLRAMIEDAAKSVHPHAEQDPPP